LITEFVFIEKRRILSILFLENTTLYSHYALL